MKDRLKEIAFVFKYFCIFLALGIVIWISFNWLHAALETQKNVDSAAKLHAKIFGRGKAAQEAGVPATANPFTYITSRTAWLDGWIEGSNE